MKTKIIGIGLVILLMGLLLSGCVSRSQYNELKAQAVQQEAQIAVLESEIEAKDVQIGELEKENLEFLKETETAEIRITFDPNPAPRQGKSRPVRVRLTEVNGVGVQLNEFIWLIYGDTDYKNDDLVGGHSYIRGDGFGLGNWLSYLPAHGSIDFETCKTCRSCGSDEKYAGYILYGTDDNGHEIIARGRLDFS